MQPIFILNLNYELFLSLMVIIFKHKLIRFSNGTKINVCKIRNEKRFNCKERIKYNIMYEYSYCKM